MKSYSHDEIRAYAKRVVRSAEQRRLFVPIFGLMMLAALGCVIWMVKEKAEALQATLVGDPHFLAGVACGILFMLIGVIGAFGTLKMLGLNRGIEYQALKRLVELEKESWKFGKTKK
jgi:hypothetical protein